MTTAADILKKIKDEDIKYVDLRFTDPRGKMQHVTFDIGLVDEDIFAEGTMFDGSSIAGWKAINESDMTLMPDPESAQLDPFFAQPTLAIFCDVLDPGTDAADMADLVRSASAPGLKDRIRDYLEQNRGQTKVVTK